MKVLIATAMYPTPQNPAFGSFVKTQVEALKWAGVDVELMVLQGRNRKLMYPQSIFQLRRRLAQNSIDVVHAHFSYVGIIARTQFSTPLVVTFHGDDLLGTVKDDGGNHTHSSRLIVGAGRLLGRMIDAAIVQSNEMAAQLNHRDNVHIVPHEVDFDVFRPTDRAQARAALGLDAAKKYLLFPNNPGIKVKRYALASQVSEAMAGEDPDVELIVVYKETQDRLALYMSACDALVFTSFQEGSPNIVKQAMACNLPIVATDVGDVRDVIDGTEWCFVCEPSVQEFSEKLFQILQHRPRTQGRQQISHFDRANVTRELIHIYEQALRRRGRR
jgi:glycosyltransferase involved in cell wall biosynthesis